MNYDVNRSNKMNNEDDDIINNWDKNNSDYTEIMFDDVWKHTSILVRGSLLATSMITFKSSFKYSYVFTYIFRIVIIMLILLRIARSVTIQSYEGVALYTGLSMIPRVSFFLIITGLFVRSWELERRKLIEHMLQKRCEMNKLMGRTDDTAHRFKTIAEKTVRLCVIISCTVFTIFQINGGKHTLLTRDYALDAPLVDAFGLEFYYVIIVLSNYVIICVGFCGFEMFALSGAIVKDMIVLWLKEKKDRQNKTVRMMQLPSIENNDEIDVNEDDLDYDHGMEEAYQILTQALNNYFSFYLKLFLCCCVLILIFLSVVIIQLIVYEAAYPTIFEIFISLVSFCLLALTYMGFMSLFLLHDTTNSARKNKYQPIAKVPDTIVLFRLWCKNLKSATICAFFAALLTVISLIIAYPKCRRKSGEGLELLDRTLYENSCSQTQQGFIVFEDLIKSAYMCTCPLVVLNFAFKKDWYFFTKYWTAVLVVVTAIVQFSLSYNMKEKYAQFLVIPSSMSMCMLACCYSFMKYEDGLQFSKLSVQQFMLQLIAYALLTQLILPLYVNVDSIIHEHKTMIVMLFTLASFLVLTSLVEGTRRLTKVMYNRYLYLLDYPHLYLIVMRCLIGIPIRVILFTFKGYLETTIFAFALLAFETSVIACSTAPTMITTYYKTGSLHEARIKAKENMSCHFWTLNLAVTQYMRTCTILFAFFFTVIIRFVYSTDSILSTSPLLVFYSLFIQLLFRWISDAWAATNLGKLYCVMIHKGWKEVHEQQVHRIIYIMFVVLRSVLILLAVVGSRSLDS